jgi:transcriptional regulator with XRE-family HTH domain
MNNSDGFYKKVGENIRARRKERGLSQEGLAKAIGLKRPSMSNIEKGRQNIP